MFNPYYLTFDYETEKYKYEMALLTKFQSENIDESRTIHYAEILLEIIFQHQFPIGQALKFVSVTATTLQTHLCGKIISTYPFGNH